MAKEIQNSESNFDVIRQYVTADKKTFELDDTQAQLLKRWNFYISLKLGGEFKTSEIVKKMMDEFAIQRSTVFNDMGNAEALFGVTSNLNKRFRMGARIDILEEKLNQLYKPADEYEEEDTDDTKRKIKVIFGSSELERLEIAAKLESILQKYYEAYPELKKNTGPRTINYNFTKNEFKTDDLPPLDEAIDMVNKYVNK